jgi:hypothetical protein
MSANLVSNPNPNPNPNPVSKLNRRSGVDTNKQRLKAISKKCVKITQNRHQPIHKNNGRRKSIYPDRYYSPEVLNHPLPIADRVEEGEIAEGLEGEGFLVENEGILNER